MHFATRGKAGHLHRQMQQSLAITLREHQQNTVQQVTSGFRETSLQFQNSLQQQKLGIQESLRPVAALQQQVSSTNRDMATIKDIFHVPNSRGNFGEFQLETLIKNSMSPSLYGFQYTLSNKQCVDCILHLPSPIGKLAIDSKFPLDSFQQLLNSNEIDTAKTAATKTKVREAVQGHVRDIASKYILQGETTKYAILFLPSEAIFLQIVNEFPEILTNANRQRVYLTSSTTLMALLEQLHSASRGLELQENTDDMVNLVQQMTTHVDRLVQRFDQEENNLGKTRAKLVKIQISITKIRKVKAELDSMGSSVARGGGGG
jgi:DNA recombination protein RmuC